MFWEIKRGGKARQKEAGRPESGASSPGKIVPPGQKSPGQAQKDYLRRKDNYLKPADNYLQASDKYLQASDKLFLPVPAFLHACKKIFRNRLPLFPGEYLYLLPREQL